MLHSHKTMDTSCHSDECIELCWKRDNNRAGRIQRDTLTCLRLSHSCEDESIWHSQHYGSPQAAIWWVTLPKNRGCIRNVYDSSIFSGFLRWANAGTIKSPFLMDEQVIVYLESLKFCAETKYAPSEIISCLILWVIYFSWCMLCFWSWCLINIRKIFHKKKERNPMILQSGLHKSLTNSKHNPSGPNSDSKLWNVGPVGVCVLVCVCLGATFSLFFEALNLFPIPIYSFFLTPLSLYRLISTWVKP